MSTICSLFQLSTCLGNFLNHVCSIRARILVVEFNMNLISIHWTQSEWNLSDTCVTPRKEIINQIRRLFFLLLLFLPNPLGPIFEFRKKKLTKLCKNSRVWVTNLKFLALQVGAIFLCQTIEILKVNMNPYCIHPCFIQLKSLIWNQIWFPVFK